MSGDTDPFESRQGTHPDIVELREQKGIDKVPALDGELRIINSFLRDLEPRRTGAEKTPTASPIEFDLQFLRARNDQRQMHTK